MNELLLASRAFLVKASEMPARTNTRPGVTLLLAREAPLRLWLEHRLLVCEALLLAPGVPRRFERPQPHYSLTIEPGHPAYLGYLAWARQHGAEPVPAAALLGPLDNAMTLADQHVFDTALCDLLLAQGGQLAAPSARLQQLLAWVDEADEDASAERLWERFRQTYGGSQAHCSRWLQQQLGLSLRQLLLWRKLRRAMQALRHDRHGTRVAHAAGFADSAHLARICQRVFGLRPSEASDIKTLQVRWLPDS